MAWNEEQVWALEAQKDNGPAGPLPAPPHTAIFCCRAAQYRQGSSLQLMDQPLPHMSSSWLPGWDLVSSQTVIPDSRYAGPATPCDR